MKCPSIIFFLFLVYTFVQCINNTDSFLIISPVGKQDHARTHSGFFSNFLSVLGQLDHYERNNYAGCTVALNWGLYFDATRGPNWWEYYFEPIYVGTAENKRTVFLDQKQKARCAYDAISRLSREKAHALIQKYVCIKPHVQQKIDDFISAHFNHEYIIGIHYRGTDKKQEAPPISYEEVWHAVRERIAHDYVPEDYTIFVATDDQRFIDYMHKNILPEKLCYYPSIRSTNGKPIHFDRSRGYQLGEEALIDCILLSQCSFLIRTQSNVSATVGNFNPKLPILSLNRLNISTQIPNVRKHALHAAVQKSKGITL